MATGKSCSRWFAPLAALLMVVSLSGCFDKEGERHRPCGDPDGGGIAQHVHLVIQ